MKSINPGRRKPKGIRLKAGEDAGRCTTPPRVNPWQGAEFAKVVIISWC